MASSTEVPLRPVPRSPASCLPPLGRRGFDPAHQAKRNAAAASITTAVTACTPYAVAFEPLRRSTIMASPTGMMLAASMNPQQARFPGSEQDEDNES